MTFPKKRPGQRAKKKPEKGQTELSRKKRASHDKQARKKQIARGGRSDRQKSTREPRAGVEQPARDGRAAGQKPARGKGEQPAREPRAFADKPVRGRREPYANDARGTGDKPVRGRREAYASDVRATGDKPVRGRREAYASEARATGDKPVRGRREAYASDVRATGDKPVRGRREAYASEARGTGDKPVRGRREAYASEGRAVGFKVAGQSAERPERGGAEQARGRRDQPRRDAKVGHGRHEQSARDTKVVRGRRESFGSDARDTKVVRGRGEQSASDARDTKVVRGRREQPTRDAKGVRGRHAQPTRDAKVGREPSTHEGAEPSPQRTPLRPRAEMVVAKPALSQMSTEPHPGHWLLATREGSEQDLVDELMLANVLDPAPRVLAPGLVLAPKIPKLEKRPIELTFARQGFQIAQSVRAHDLDEITARVFRTLRTQLEKAPMYGLHVWVADSTVSNPLSSMADELDAKLSARLAEALPKSKRVDDSTLRRLGPIPFAQVCLIDTERAVAGVNYSNAVPSLARGGRTRVRVTGNFPSRAARKLEEALAWIGVEPGPGDLCVDLGAAPGGWTYVLAERRARVIAVDPAKLRPEILAKKGVRHVQESAFTYKPDEDVDWLFCDMAWRPLEAAALLAKWGRLRRARIVVANIKLPMTKKAEILARVRKILELEGDWKSVRAKQLYHDRDEITLTAHMS